MVFAFLRAKRKLSLKRRLALTKNGRNRYLEIVRFVDRASGAATFRELFLLPNVSCLMEYVVQSSSRRDSLSV